MDLLVHERPHCKATLELLCLQGFFMHLTFRSASRGPLSCTELSCSVIPYPVQELIDLHLSVSAGLDTSSWQNGQEASPNESFSWDLI